MDELGVGDMAISTQPILRQGLSLARLAVVYCLFVYRAFATPAFPVVEFPAQCAAACDGFPVATLNDCMLCTVTTSNAFTVWNDTSQPGLPRFPLYERNFTALPGLIVLNPLTDVYIVSLNGGILDLWTTAPTNEISICSPAFGSGTSPRCITRTAAPVLKENTDGSVFWNESRGSIYGVGCIEEQGWLSPVTWAPDLYAPACPGSPNLTEPTDAHFTKPEHLAMMVPEFKAVARHLQASHKRKAQAVFTSVAAAADSFWELDQIAWGSPLFYHNVSRSDLPRLRKLYGAKWQRGWESLVNTGDLVELDHTWVEGLPPSERWNAAAHVLLRYMKSKGRVWLRAFAIRLSNVADNPSAYEVYTPQQSNTAFIRACVVTRSVITMAQLFASHIYNYHAIQSGITYSLYNTIDAGVPVGMSSHPVRMIMDEFANPRFNAGFYIYELAGILPPTPVSITYSNIDPFLSVIEQYAKSGPLHGPATLYNVGPVGFLPRTELSPERFTSPGGKSFDLYPAARIFLDAYELASAFVEKVVNIYYPNDAAVAADQEIQNFAAAMIDPLAGNLVKFSETNRIRTKKELVDIIGFSVSLTALHVLVYNFEFTGWNYNLAMFSQTNAVPGLFNATATYSLAELVGSQTSSHAYSKQMTVSNFLLTTQKSPPWVPYKCHGNGTIYGTCPYWYEVDANGVPLGEPDYEAPISNYNTSTPAGRQAFAAAVEWRKAWPTYVAGTNNTRVAWAYLTPDQVAVMLPKDMTV